MTAGFRGSWGLHLGGIGLAAEGEEAAATVGFPSPFAFLATAQIPGSGMPDPPAVGFLGPFAFMSLGAYRQPQTLNATVERLTYDAIKFTWGPLTAAYPDGSPIPTFYSDFGDRTVEVEGTWDGATFKYQGSNRGSSYVSLTDQQGNAIEKTVDAIEAVIEDAGLQRPLVLGGDELTSLYCTVVARRNKFS